MNFIRALLRKNENPYYTKLRSCLQKRKMVYDISKAYFLFGVLYHEGIISEIKNAIADNKLNQLKQSAIYDVTKDNIELYLLQDRNHNLSIVVLLDYYELFTPEEIIAIIPVQTLNIERELIFSEE